MPIYDIAFYGILFFLVGVLFSSAAVPILIISLSVILFFVFCAVFGFTLAKPRAYILGLLSLTAVLGSIYFIWDDWRFNTQPTPFSEVIEAHGIIRSDPTSGGQIQSVVLELDPPYGGRILVQSRGTDFQYGDTISVRGQIDSPRDIQEARRFGKDRIRGAMRFPEEARLILSGSEFSPRRLLFNFKNRLLSVFSRALPKEEAAFLSGITLGYRATLSPEFKEALSRSGTTHLIALSGYNIAVVAAAVSAALGFFLKRRLSFFVTLAAIFTFVLMTGAEASVVRAGIMAAIALLANEVERLYSVRNSIIIAAFVMVIANPKALAFDIGFQLSFIALLGIVYLRPAILDFLRSRKHRPRERRLNAIAESFFTTLSAQLAVLPILVSSFGLFSIAALVSNILILGVVPLTMALGFIISGSGLLSGFLGVVASWIARPLLVYQIFIIKLFSRLDFLVIQSRDLGIVFWSLYALLIGWFLARYYMKKTRATGANNHD